MNTKNINYLLIGLMLCAFTFSACSSESKQPEAKYIEEGLDKVIKANRDLDNYTVLLWDMDYKDKKYMHKYMVVSEKMDSVVENEETEWMEVSPQFFQANENHLDMELATKTAGKLSKEVAPPGFSQYVGNEKYGQWKEKDGDRFWEFAGRYAFMSLMFHSIMTPRYSSWNTHRGSYRGTGKPYYGSGGSQYGTSKSLASGSARKTNWSAKPATFRDKVRTQVRQSTSAASRAPSSSSKTKRNTNRHTPSSSSRSRGGGFGK